MPRFDQDWNDTGGRLACQHRSILTLPAASVGVVGPISEIPAEDRPANRDWYIGRPIFSHGWTDQDQRYWQETGKPTQIDTLASQHRLIHWPPIFGHCSIKIRNIGKTSAGQHKSIHCRQFLATVGPRSGILAKDRPANIDRNIGRPFLGHCWTKIRNTGPR